MKPIRQRNNHDCLTAAVATLLGITYEECPQLWVAQTESWLPQLTRWATEKGFCVIYAECPPHELDRLIMHRVPVVLLGEVKRGDRVYDHAVVAEGNRYSDTSTFTLKYDPWGDNKLLDRVSEYIMIFPVPVQPEV